MIEDHVDFRVCPCCGSDDTIHSDDLVYEYGYTIRDCDSCGKKYKVMWSMYTTTSFEIPLDK